MSESVAGRTAGGRRGVWIEVDLDAIRHNVRLIRSLSGVAVTPVVKADAYGHGMPAVADAIADLVDGCCVATLDEALALRALGTRRVLMLYPVPREAAAEAAASGAELSVMSSHDLAALREAVPDAAAGRPPVALQLCVETGLGRGGLCLPELADVVAGLRGDPRFRIAGLWSHLASPGDAAACANQVARFEAAADTVRAAGTSLPPRHIGSCGSIFAGTAPAYDLVRPGLAVYGVLDDELPISAAAREAAAALRPAMALKARPIAMCEVPVGETVGYGGQWVAQRPSRIAILPLGYADGYLRGSQPGAEALVRGRRVPLAGVISMDSLAVDVTDVPGVDRADEVVLLGRQGGESIAAADLARRRNTIAWEVLSSMALRLDRVYHRTAGTVQRDI